MLSDWLATFADAANIHAPARTDGVSLLPSLTGNGKQQESLVYSEYSVAGKTPDFEGFEQSRRGRTRGQMQMIRIGDIVGVRYQVESANDDFELYDVVKDPKQINNLALLPAFKNLQERMKTRVLQIRKADKEAPRPYDNALVPAADVSDNVLAGLRWKFFKGNFPWVVSEDNLQENANGVIKDIPKNGLISSSGMTLYEGFIKIPADGEYSFSLQATGKAYMRIHQAELIDADFGYLSGSQETAGMYLKAGYHPIKIYHLKESGKRAVVSIKIKHGDADWWPLKPGDLYHLK